MGRVGSVRFSAEGRPAPIWPAQAEVSVEQQSPDPLA